MKFKVLQYNTDLHKINVVVYIGVVVPRNSVAIGYNYALETKSDAYLP